MRRGIITIKDRNPTETGRTKGGKAVAKYSAQISFRSTPEFKEALEKRAKQERMSVSTLILKVMEDYLEQQKK